MGRRNRGVRRLCQRAAQLGNLRQVPLRCSIVLILSDSAGRGRLAAESVGRAGGRVETSVDHRRICVLPGERDGHKAIWVDVRVEPRAVEIYPPGVL